MSDTTSKAAANWNNVSLDDLPPEGEVVDTISPGGLQRHLQRQGRLWFVPDGGMYVYYTPLFWRRLET